MDWQPLQAVPAAAQAAAMPGTTKKTQPAFIKEINVHETATRPRNVILTAELTFINPTQSEDWSMNHCFSGRGLVEVGPDWVVLSGKKRRFLWFGKKAAVTVWLRGILNVDRNGRRLQFELQSSADDPAPTKFRIRMRTEREAEYLSSLLAKTQTADFAQMKQFWAQLREFTPHSFIVQTFICINVLIFLIMTAARFTHPLAPTPRSAGSLSADLQFYVDWGANYGPLTNNGQPWRLLTCTFLHFGFLHLAANLFALYAVGNLVARMYGNVRFLLLYIGAGLAGSLMSVTFKPTTVSGGASGAIFGICSGLLAYLVSQSESVPPLVRNKLALSISIFSAYSLVAGFLQPGIDNAAHIGGLVGGAILGLLLSLTLPAPAKRNGGVRHD